MGSSKIKIHIGAVGGPIFGLIDVDQIDKQNSVCLKEMLNSLPINLLPVNQIICIVSRERFVRLGCVGERCGFHQAYRNAIPDVDYICRAWFADKNLNGRSLWPEASISFGGMLFAADFLRRTKKIRKQGYRFAFWSPGEKSYENFNVEHCKKKHYRLIIKRRDFFPNAKMIKKLRSVSETYIESDYFQVKSILEKRLKHPNILVEVKQSSPSNSGIGELSRIDMFPYIPVFIGELHRVIPVGSIAERLNILLKETPFYDYFINYFKISRSFFQNAAKEGLLNDLSVENSKFGFDGNFGSEPGYPDHAISSGWTILKDRFWSEDHEKNSELRREFLTLEPIIPHAPFGYSASGALAAAIGQVSLDAKFRHMPFKMKGRRIEEKPLWVESEFEDELGEVYLSVSQTDDDHWAIVAPVQNFGEFKLIAKNFAGRY